MPAEGLIARKPTRRLQGNLETIHQHPRRYEPTAARALKPLSGHYACVAGPVRTPRTGRVTVAVAILLLVPAVIAWRAWPAAEHRLSLKDAERACREVAAHHGGRVSTYWGDSVDNAAKLNQGKHAFHAEAAAFLASIPKSNGVAVCSVWASDLPVCAADRDSVPPLGTVLATPDGGRSVSWCPLPRD